MVIAVGFAVVALTLGIAPYRRQAGTTGLTALCLFVAVVALLRPTPFVLLALFDVVGFVGLTAWSRHDRAIRNERATLPELADAISTSLRGGTTLAAALDVSSHLASGRLRSSLDSMARALHLGVPVREVMADVRHRPGRHDHETQLLMAAIEVGYSHPTQRGRALADAASSLRLRRLRREDLTAQAAQARASATVVTWSPWVVVVLASLVDSSHLERLAATSYGRWCVVGAGALSLTGAAAMRIMIYRTGLS